MNNKSTLLAAVALVALATTAAAQVLHDYNPPALGSSEAVQRNDLNAEYDGINTDKVDPVDIDTSVEIRAIVGDEIGTGELLFGIAATMTDDLGCTSLQVIRRNAADTAFECSSPGGGGDALVANPLSQFAATTSAQLRGVLSDEIGTGAAMFGLISTMADDLGCTASQFVRRNAGDTAFECGAGSVGLATTDIDTSAELRTLMIDELGTGVLFFLGAPAADDQVFISSSISAGAWSSLPDSDGVAQKLQYDVATNAFTTGTDDDLPEAGDFGNLSAVTPIVQSGGSITTSMATARLIGRTTAATGEMEQIAVDSTLALSALNLGVAASGIAIGNMADDSIGIDELDLVTGNVPVNGDCLTYDTAAGGTIEAITCPGAAGGDQVSFNSVAVIDPDFDDAVPAAPAGAKNVEWQVSGTDVSGHIDEATTAAPGVGELSTTTETLTGTATNRVNTPDSIAALWEKGANEASAGAVSLGEGYLFHVTGTTTITDIDWDTPKDGRCAVLVFDAALTITHNATTLILSGAENIITVAGDKAIVCQDSGDNVIMVDFTRQAASLEFLNPTESFCIAFSDDTGTALTTGVAKITWRMPYAFTITGIRASLTGASSSGAPIFDVNEGGTSIMTTNKLLIDQNELTTVTATVAPTVTDLSLADDALMTLDVDVAGTGSDGGKMCMIGRRT